MADMPQKDQPEIPHPGIDITKTPGWISVADPRFLDSAFKIMVANNMEVTASQIAKCIDMIDALHAKVDGLTGSSRRRRSSGASSLSQASSGAVGDEGDEGEENAPSGSQEERDVHNVLVTQYEQRLFDLYQTWIDETGKKPYMVRSDGARAEAKEFKSHLLNAALPVVLDEEWPEHELKELLEQVTDFNWLSMFISFGKNHPRNAKKKTGSSGRVSAMKSKGQGSKGKKVVQTTSASQNTVREEFSGDEGRPIELDEDDDNNEGAGAGEGEGEGNEYNDKITLEHGGMRLTISPAKASLRQKKASRLHAGSIFTPPGNKGKATASVMSPSPSGSGSGSKQLKRTSGQRGSASGGEGQKRRASARKFILDEDDIVDDDDAAVDDADDDDDDGGDDGAVGRSH